jgi:hypothetical protein
VELVREMKSKKRRKREENILLKGIVKVKGVIARALPSLLAMRSLASRTDPLRMSNLISIRIRVFKGFFSLLLSSLFIFKLSFITSL